MVFPLPLLCSQLVQANALAPRFRSTPVFRISKHGKVLQQLKPSSSFFPINFAHQPQTSKHTISTPSSQFPDSLSGFLEHLVKDPPPRWPCLLFGLFILKCLPVDFSSSGIDIDLVHWDPRLAFPDECDQVEEYHNEEGQVGLEEGLDI